MTIKDYNEYVKRVEAMMEKYDIHHFSPTPSKVCDYETEHPGDCDCEEYIEPYFSWDSCDCCGSTLGGDRYDVDTYSKRDNEVLEFSICSDCLFFAEYGQLDDMTMMDLV